MFVLMAQITGPRNFKITTGNPSSPFPLFFLRHLALDILDKPKNLNSDLG